MIDDKVIEACSRAAHEVNRAYCLALGDTSQPPWDEAPQWQKSSARNGVAGALAGNTPEQSHELWLAEKKAAGWKYGPVKDPEKKEHPCFVPYDELTANQRHKDLLFVGVVRTMAAVLGATVVYPAMPAGNGMPAFPERTIDWSNVDEDVMELVDAARQLVKFEREMRLWRERGEIATEAFIKSLENRSERLLDALAVATHKVAERSRGETAPAPTKDQYAAVCRERDEAREVAKAAVALLDARYLLDEDYERGEDGWFLPADRIRLRDEMLRKAKR